MASLAQMSAIIEAERLKSAKVSNDTRARIQTQKAKAEAETARLKAIKEATEALEEQRNYNRGVLLDQREYNEGVVDEQRRYSAGQIKAELDRIKKETESNYKLTLLSDQLIKQSNQNDEMLKQTLKAIAENPKLEGILLAQNDQFGTQFGNEQLVENEKKYDYLMRRNDEELNEFKLRTKTMELIGDVAVQEGFMVDYLKNEGISKEGLYTKSGVQEALASFFENNDPASGGVKGLEAYLQDKAYKYASPAYIAALNSELATLKDKTVTVDGKVIDNKIKGHNLEVLENPPPPSSPGVTTDILEFMKKRDANTLALLKPLNQAIDAMLYSDATTESLLDKSFKGEEKMAMLLEYLEKTNTTIDPNTENDNLEAELGQVISNLSNAITSPIMFYRSMNSANQGNDFALLDAPLPENFKGTSLEGQTLGEYVLGTTAYRSMKDAYDVINAWPENEPMDSLMTNVQEEIDLVTGGNSEHPELKLTPAQENEAKMVYEIMKKNNPDLTIEDIKAELYGWEEE